jgi:sec-independent protein translocase protein TatB
MFDIGWQELLIVAVLVIVVVGPKDLPRTLRAIMGLVRKGRMLARDFQNGIDDVIREADLDDMRKQITDAGDNDIAGAIKETLDPDGDIAKDLDMTDVTDEMNKAASVEDKPAIEDETGDVPKSGKDA